MNSSATQSITMMTWVKSSGDGILFTQRRSNACQGNYSLQIKSGKAFGWIYLNAGVFPQDVYSLTGATSVNDNVWHHLAFVRSGSTLSLYVDGSLNAGGTATTGPLAGGGSGYNAGVDRWPDFGACTSFFTGYEDDLRLYNRALSASEIQSIYNSTK